VRSFLSLPGDETAVSDAPAEQRVKPMMAPVPMNNATWITK